MKYVPSAVPNDARPGLRAWLANELRHVANALLSLEPNDVVLTELHDEPDRLFTGLTVMADGSDWDPGSGQGVYTYYNGQWNKLG